MARRAAEAAAKAPLEGPAAAGGAEGSGEAAAPRGQCMAESVEAHARRQEGIAEKAAAAKDRCFAGGVGNGEEDDEGLEFHDAADSAEGVELLRQNAGRRGTPRAAGAGAGEAGAGDTLRQRGRSAHKA